MCPPDKFTACRPLTYTETAAEKNESSMEEEKGDSNGNFPKFIIHRSGSSSIIKNQTAHHCDRIPQAAWVFVLLIA